MVSPPFLCIAGVPSAHTLYQKQGEGNAFMLDILKVIGMSLGSAIVLFLLPS